MATGPSPACRKVGGVKKRKNIMKRQTEFEALENLVNAIFEAGLHNHPALMDVYNAALVALYGECESMKDLIEQFEKELQNEK